ncbi:MFS transporter [Saccharospirillum sp. HFRX-1]|uniref:MFS transporter n=1 Tax=unclassified Saccharospirillum TaxID=2633430 RepID=UPI003722EB1A
MTTTTTQHLGRLGLVLLLCGQMLPLIDVAIINVALNTISASLNASQIELELLMSVYSLALALTLAFGGRSGDRFGRRRVLNIGVALFGLASLFCGLATNIPILLVGRFLQGIAGGLIIPQVLATIHVSLSGRAHSNAIGIFGAVIGLSFLIGQILGGWIIAADIAGTGWRGIFLVNVPVCLLVLLLGPRFIPQTRSGQPAGFDVSGTLLLAVAIASILSPLAIGPLLDWPRWCFVLMLVGVALLPLFLQLERRKEHQHRWPLIPPSLMQTGSVRFGLVLALFFFTYVSGMMFCLALSFQMGLGMTAQQSGNAFIACGVAFFAASYVSARITARLGLLNTLLFGCVLTLLGLVWLPLTLASIWSQPDAVQLIGSTVLLGFGQALVLGSFFRIGLSQVPAEQAGSASAVLSTAQQICLCFGPAFYGLVVHQMSLTEGLLAGLTAAFHVQLIAIAALAFATLVYIRLQRRTATGAV